MGSSIAVVQREMFLSKVIRGQEYDLRMKMVVCVVSRKVGRKKWEMQTGRGGAGLLAQISETSLRTSR